MKQAKILVIDDDAAVRQVICDTLCDSGYQIKEAQDGIEGLKIITQGYDPDIVISDIIMPRMEGIETIVELRKRFHDLKVIAISGGGRTKITDFLQLAEKFGADASIQKPIDMDNLEKIIISLLAP